MSLRQRIEQAADLRTEVVSVPEWACDVQLRELSGAARAQLRESATADGGKPDHLLNERIVALALYEDGAPVFNAANPEDLELLASKNGTVIERLAGKVLVLSGLAPASVEDAEKKS